VRKLESRLGTNVTRKRLASLSEKKREHFKEMLAERKAALARIEDLRKEYEEISANTGKAEVRADVEVHSDVRILIQGHACEVDSTLGRSVFRLDEEGTAVVRLPL